MMKALEVDEQAQKVELKSVKQNWQYNRVVHGSHSWAIFGSFSNSFLAHFHLFGRGTNKKGLKMEWKMM